MKSFIDTEGDEWEYKIGNHQIRKIADNTGVNLVNLEMDALEANSYKLLDTQFMIACLYWCCHKAAVKRKVTMEDFDERLEVEDLTKINEDFVEELRFFFQRTGQKALEWTERQVQKSAPKVDGLEEQTDKDDQTDTQDSSSGSGGSAEL